VRILVTGASGQLGSELVALAPAVPHEILGVTAAECDIRDADAVESMLRDSSPHMVINCAAWTQVDLAESHRDEAFAVNAGGAANLARSCAGSGALLCHLSTDYVFGTAGAPLDETAEPLPLSVYGASKLAGEDAVREALPDRHVIVRSAWLFGREGPNFVLTMLRLAREQRPIRVVADQQGSPTWTGHLAPALLRLIELDARGTVHLTAGGSTTWCDFAQAIIDEAGFTRPAVERITTSDYPTAATRPRYSVLDNRRWRELGQAPLPGWREGLRAYLAQLTEKTAHAGSGRENSP
jgi:dTDP-4-dehydrorhamnose reductase